jgi:hypothetical protein
MKRPSRAESEEMIRKLLHHLDWCGWGDSWERECSEPLRAEAEQFLKRLPEPVN